MDLPGKNIVLTGATGGIGSLLTKLLRAEGANLYLLGRDLSKLKALSSSYQTRFLHCDLTKRPERDLAISTILDSGIKTDLLINCAGVGIYKKLANLTESDWYRSYELNVHTPFFLVKKLHPELTVNLGSCSAVHHQPERSLYNSTKAALRSLTLCLAQELPNQLIHITLDSTLTDFGPLTIQDKEELTKNGKIYLDPTWVAAEIVKIISLPNYDPEYTLSPECYTNCGTWLQP